MKLIALYYMDCGIMALVWVWINVVFLQFYTLFSFHWVILVLKICCLSALHPYRTLLLVCLENHITLLPLIQMSAVRTSWLLFLNSECVCRSINLSVWHDFPQLKSDRNTKPTASAWQCGDGLESLTLNKAKFVSPFMHNQIRMPYSASK